MFRKIIIVSAVFSLALAVNFAAAAGSKNKGLSSFRLRTDAVEVADGVYKLGNALDSQTHELIEGYAIVHKKKAYARSSGSKLRSPSCYAYMAAGAKWKNLENWVVNPANNSGLADSFVKDTLAEDIALWEDASDGVVGNGAGVNILGEGSITSETLVADQIATDGKNEVYFDDLGADGTIAITIVWGIFGGPTFNRRLVEWDQVYNTYYAWSASGEADKMDFDSIAQHELGHSIGLADIYSGSCSAVTMYGYADYGQTNKQTLELPDINGINKLY